VVHGDKLKRHHGQPLSDWFAEHGQHERTDVTDADRNTSVSSDAAETEVKTASPRQSPVKRVRFRLDSDDWLMNGDPEVMTNGAPRIRRTSSLLNDCLVY